MTNEELGLIKATDSYFQPRKDPTDREHSLYLREVDFSCPLCGKTLRSRRQRKNNRLYQIAHIYPNSPTLEQYEVLKGLERLGKSTESFDNKIALCMECHNTQDYHTTKDDYMKLLEIKKRLLNRTALMETVDDLGLQAELASILEQIVQIPGGALASLNYDPVKVKKKFSVDEFLLETQIENDVLHYYPYVRDILKEYDGKNGFSMEVLSMQIKAAFIKMNNETENKEELFHQLVNWILHKSCSESRRACEVVVAFFVQNCEVFYEITE